MPGMSTGRRQALRHCGAGGGLDLTRDLCTCHLCRLMYPSQLSRLGRSKTASRAKTWSGRGTVLSPTLRHLKQPSP